MSVAYDIFRSAMGDPPKKQFFPQRRCFAQPKFHSGNDNSINPSPPSSQEDNQEQGTLSSCWKFKVDYDYNREGFIKMEALSVRDLNPIHSLVTGLKLSVQANNECFGEIFCIFNKIFNPLLKLTKYKVFILIKFCNGVTKSCKVRTTQRLRITASEQ